MVAFGAKPKGLRDMLFRLESVAAGCFILFITEGLIGELMETAALPADHIPVAARFIIEMAAHEAPHGGYPVGQAVGAEQFQGAVDGHVVQAPALLVKQPLNLVG